MIKLKFNLDPADRNQMLALSRFAGTLAGAGVEIEAIEPKSLKLSSAKVDGRPPEESAWEKANGNTEPVEEVKTTTRKRRTKAEIEAERAAANAEIPEEYEGDEAEEVESEEAEEQKPKKSGKQITMDDVRAIVAEKKDKHFDTMKRELLNRYGVATTPKLPEEHWAAFFDFVNGLK